MAEFDEDKERGMMLAERLKAKELTQTKFAEMIGVSQPTVSRWVTGEEKVPESRYEKIAETLDLELDMIRSGSYYVRSDKQINRWRMEVLGNTPNIYAMTAILTFPHFMRKNGEVLVYEELVAAKVTETITLEQIQDAWPSVLNSPYVERVPGAKWVFRLKFADDDDNGL